MVFGRSWESPVLIKIDVDAMKKKNHLKILFRAALGGGYNAKYTFFRRFLRFLKGASLRNFSKCLSEKNSKKRCEREKHISTKVFAIFKTSESTKKAS